MNKPFFIISMLGLMLLISCNKKTTPSASEKKVESTESVKTGTNKPVNIKTPTPSVITVNDKVAKKSADGRLYYDLEGKRYWKNYKTGKYYLYHKSMHENPDFRPSTL